MTTLLVWAVAVVVVDAAVILQHDEHHSTATGSRSSSSSGSPTSSSTTAPTASGADSTPATGDTVPTGTATDAAPSTSTTLPPPPTETTPSGEVVVAHLRGDGETLASVGFHVDGHWQLRWHVEPGNGVAATVDNDDDPDHPVLFAGLTPGDGSTDVGTGCNCTLHLTPDGSAYDVLVVDVEG